MAKIREFESGRSGRAGYTDPNNNDYLKQRNKYGGDRDDLWDGLVGFHGLHRVSRLEEYSTSSANASMSND